MKLSARKQRVRSAREREAGEPEEGDIWGREDETGQGKPHRPGAMPP